MAGCLIVEPERESTIMGLFLLEAHPPLTRPHNNPLCSLARGKLVDPEHGPKLLKATNRLFEHSDNMKNIVRICLEWSGAAFPYRWEGARRGPLFFPTPKQLSTSAFGPKDRSFRLVVLEFS